MTFPGRKPQIKEVLRTKNIVHGKEKVGKTYFALDFPNVFYIDVESGAKREQYQEKLINSNGWYMGQEDGSLDFNTVIDVVRKLAVEKHEYKTLVIDSFTKLYKTERSIAEEKLGDVFGRDKKEANKPSRRLLRWLDRLDMNVILVCWSKDKWAGTGEDRHIIGTTFEGFDDFAYELDLLIEAVIINGQRKFVVKASRVKELPEGTIGDLDFSSFAKVFGYEKLVKSHEVFVPASDEQLGVIQRIKSEAGFDEEKMKKWMQKNNAEELSELSFETAKKFIDLYQTKKGEHKDAKDSK